MHLLLKASIDLYLKFLSISSTSADLFEVDDVRVIPIMESIIDLTCAPVLVDAVLKM